MIDARRRTERFSMIRVHVHLKAANLDSSREFYEAFFGVPPVKLKPDQIKFLPPLAPLNLTIHLARAPRRECRRLSQPPWHRSGIAGGG
jgi:catechol 2,3-dioxygenase-like lactoylglutathione lyase family enzyme